MKYAAIADWAAEKEFPVTFLCAQLGLACQGYYRWLAAGPCERERTDAELTDQIHQIHTELEGRPGVRRVWAELVVRGFRGARHPLVRRHHLRAHRRGLGTKENEVFRTAFMLWDYAWM